MSRLRMSGSQTGLREKSSLSLPEVQIRCRETLFSVTAGECDVDCKVWSRRGTVDTMLVYGRTRERWMDSGFRKEEARMQSFLRRPKRSGRSGTFQKTETPLSTWCLEATTGR